MNTDRYRRLNLASAKHSDEHVECMTDWIRRSRLDSTHVEKCVAVAVRYKNALEKELAYLKTRPQTEDVLRRTVLVHDYLTLVERDLTLLRRHGGH